MEKMKNKNDIFMRSGKQLSDIVISYHELYMLALADPEQAFEAAKVTNAPAAYATLAVIYRSMIERGKGDPELVAKLWGKCLAESAEYLGIVFPEEKTPKLRAVYKSHQSVPRAKGARAVLRKD